ncbi:hypothetical protein GIB67_026008 [Kingdonia uniflora]|uniref:Uncharacterized protein n=1 Tax=Kingdonia uniflora TaxID=39325 RepID=A0A7J7M2T6_9MAGN|nr:hypothetical protein GIB67_026008 [Kingdonia uniflora]
MAISSSTLFIITQNPSIPNKSKSKPTLLNSLQALQIPTFGCKMIRQSRLFRWNNNYLQVKFARKSKLKTCALKEDDLSFAADNSLKGQVIVGSAVTVVLAVANRVLYKLALVPMKEYPFFLAQVTTFGYVAIYFSILFVRYYYGIVTGEMLALPKSRFMLIGVLEALGVATGMSAGAMLPGPAIPILSQDQMKPGALLELPLRTSRSSVYLGVCLALDRETCGSGDGQMLSNVDFVWPALMIVSSAFQAGASILKEFVFVDAAKRLKGKPLDIFVVNSFGSGFQALFVLLFLPFLSKLKGCKGSPLLPLLFITTNMAFNISLLNLVKISSAVVSSLAATLSVPIAIFVLTLPLPYLPEGSSLSPFFLFGSMILVLGLVLYGLPLHAKPSSERL